MTRRILMTLFVLAVVPLALLAQAEDRDVLLTPGGTLYTVESDFVENYGLDVPSNRVLRLTIQQDGETRSVFVPATLHGGVHSSPALAYEAETDTLFLLWQKLPNHSGSELTFVSYRDSEWSRPTTIDPAPFTFRKNLRIGVSRFVREASPGKEESRERGTVIHAVWWEDTGSEELARYAMLAVDEGKVVSTETHDLRTFVPAELLQSESADEVATLEQPLVFELPNGEGVDVLFGVVSSNGLYRVELTTVRATSVVTVPIGRSRVRRIPMQRLTGNSTGRISGLTAPGGSETLVLYSVEEGRLHYAIHSEAEGWSKTKSIVLNESITPETAVLALRKMVSSE